MESSPTQNMEFTPAPYGRACTGCARAKYRCIYRADSISCERCHRLKKDCQRSTSTRVRKVKKVPNSKTAGIEGKLDELVSLLRSQANHQQPHQAASPSSQLNSGVASDDLHANVESTTASSLNSVTDAFISTMPAVPAMSTPVVEYLSGGIEASSTNDIVDAYGIPDTTATEQLETFRRVFLPLFPFVNIPVSTTTTDLCRQRPFLYLVIISITTKSGTQQLAMGESIRQMMAQRAIAEHQISLDILLGILCYIGWSHYHKKMYKPYMIAWVQVAVALVYELGIHKHRPVDLGPVGYNAALYPPRTPVGKLRTMEERRAILATFLISSQVWIAMRKMAPVRWTPYMEDCVRVLIEECETDLDIVLATQSRCHVIINEMTYSVAEWAAEGGQSTVPPPPPYFTKVMQTQLQNIRQNLPAEMRSNSVIGLYLHSTEALLKEPLLYQPKDCHNTGLPHLQRIEELNSILTSIERWLEALFEISVPNWIGLTFGIFNQLTHCIMLLFKISTLDEPGWDTDEVTKRADPVDVLERIAERLESLPRLRGVVDTDGIGGTAFLFTSADVFRSLMATLLAQKEVKLVQRQARVEGNPDQDKVLAESLVLDDVDSTFTDSAWATDIFIPFWQF